MMRVIYDRELAALEQDMVELGAMCEKAITLAAGGLFALESARSGRVRELSHEIDKKERDIQNRCSNSSLSPEICGRSPRR